MSVIYSNPPLVELIAELWWGPEAEQVAADVYKLSGSSSKLDDIALQFSSVIAGRGYARLERLTPAGMPLPPQMLGFRYRPTDASKASPLFQLGQGIFTANGLPPEYSSWAEFSPAIRLGVDSLFEAHRRANAATPKIRMATVRYIDAFRADLTGGAPLLEFMRDVLGVEISLPQAIVGKTRTDGELQTTLRLDVPLDVGQMTISIGRGMRDGEVAAMLDTTVRIQRSIGSSAEEAVSTLTEARQIVHDLFRDLTKPIHEKMRPK